MGTRKRFPYILTVDDIVDTELEIQNGQVTGFALNYRAFIDGAWQEALRYDTRHGRLHAHRFWLPARQQVETMRQAAAAKPDYSSWYTHLRKDLDTNWKAYRAAFEGRASNAAQ